MRGFLHWLLPVLGLIGTGFAVWLLWFQRHNTTARQDAALLAYIGGCYAVAIGFLLIYTRRWTLRGLGQVATYAADATIYLGLGGAGLGWWPRLGPAEVNAIRSAFVVGGTALVAGLVWWAWANRKRPTPPTAPADEMAVTG